MMAKGKEPGKHQESHATPDQFPERPLGLNPADPPANAANPVEVDEFADREPEQDAGGRRIVPFYRQCPICFHGEMNGVGTCYSTKSGSKRHYKCGACGHTWTWTLPQIAKEIAHREHRLSTR